MNTAEYLINLSRINVHSYLRGGFGVLVRAKLALSDTVAMQLSVRSEDPQVAEIMATAVA